MVRVRIEDLPEAETWPRHQIVDETLIVTPYAGTSHQALVAQTTVVLLAIEAVSPSSRTMDTMPATCAAWGVPAHLVVAPGPVGTTLTWHGDTSAPGRSRRWKPRRFEPGLSNLAHG